ncbi:hypothetical protein [Salinibacterium sp.]|uniref:hypothetical protein n=1 Tax=Salinibacterium sp. TaxID=1915057 RepID=UPI00286A9105|nr:hypothetical protein [Salinibacterium sp.]
MRTLYERLDMMATLVVIALAISQESPQAFVIVGVAAVLLASAVRSAAVVVGSLEVTVGSRARAHREALSGMPAPRHPSTAGLPLTRAPSQGIAA